MKVTGICGSPRSCSSSGMLVSRALEGAASLGAETAFFRLGTMDVKGCLACYACRNSGKCIQKDGMQEIYEALRSSSALVLGTPVYMYGPSSQTKAFVDRLFALIGQGFRSRLGKGMPLLTIYTQGAADPGLFTGSFDMLEKALDMLGLHPAGRIPAAGIGEPSDLEGRPELMDEAFRQGGSLVSGKRRNQAGKASSRSV